MRWMQLKINQCFNGGQIPVIFDQQFKIFEKAAEW